MRAKSATRNEPKEKAIRKSRWHKDKNGRYHYAGVSPFNNSVCKFMNHFAGRNDLPQGVEQ